MIDVLRLSLAVHLWLVGFSAVYALQGLSCSRHWPEGLDARTVLIVAVILFVMVQAMILGAMFASRSSSGFVQTTPEFLVSPLSARRSGPRCP